MKVFLMLTLLAALPCGAWSAAPADTDESKPDAGVKRLEYFIGTWHTEGNMKESIFGPADKSSGTDRYEWAENHAFQILHHEEKHSSGTSLVLKIVGYDSEKKRYRGYSFDGEGGVSQSEGSFTRGTWIWAKTYQLDGKGVKTRSVVTPISPTAFEWKWQIAPHGSDWTTVQEGKATKVN